MVSPPPLPVMKHPAPVTRVTGKRPSTSKSPVAASSATASRKGALVYKTPSEKGTSRTKPPEGPMSGAETSGSKRDELKEMELERSMQTKRRRKTLEEENKQKNDAKKERKDAEEKKDS